MTVTLSLVLVFGVVVALMLRSRAVGIVVAATCALFGFYLADTDAAASIHDAVTRIADAIADIG